MLVGVKTSYTSIGFFVHFLLVFLLASQLFHALLFTGTTGTLLCQASVVFSTLVLLVNLHARKRAKYLLMVMLVRGCGCVFGYWQLLSFAEPDGNSMHAWLLDLQTQVQAFREGNDSQFRSPTLAR